MKLTLIFMFSVIISQLSAVQLQVACSVPELADLVRQVGGDRVKAFHFVRPRENPHFVTARPSFIRKLASADALVVVGMDLEVGWIPALQKSARNNKVRLGAPGYMDCSLAITPLDVPSGDYNRSAGDVHPHGNPHYLLSPLCGMQVALFIAERLAAIDVEGAATYQQGAQRLVQKLGRALYGQELVDHHGLDMLIAWHSTNQLFTQIQANQFGGWLKDLQAIRGWSFIDDHPQWPYLAQCFDFRIAAHLEPKAGIPPTSGHLQQIVQLVREQGIAGILSAPWFDPRHAQTVQSQSDIVIVRLAHQVGSLPQTDTFFAMCQHNVSALSALVHAE